MCMLWVASAAPERAMYIMTNFACGLGGGVDCGGVVWVCWLMCIAPFRLIFWIVTVYKKPLGGCTLPLGGLEIFMWNCSYVCGIIIGWSYKIFNLLHCIAYW